MNFFYYKYIKNTYNSVFLNAVFWKYTINQVYYILYEK